MKSAFLLLAVIGVAAAACPNSCSGHGRCNEIDRCVCYNSQGTVAGLRDAWTGADCSQRVCPYGTAFDTISDATQEIITPIGHIPVTANDPNALKAYLVNGLHVPFDYNVEIEILSWTNGGGNLGPGTLRYRRDTDLLFSAPVAFDTTATGAGSTAALAIQLNTVVDNIQTDTGVWVYFDTSLYGGFPPSVGEKWFLNVTYNAGQRFTASDDNSVHQPAECSGRGTCNRATGQCACYAGFTGDACARTACPNDCSGHGFCQALSRFARDASLTYAGWDAEKNVGCKCDIGYRGADCSQLECPSGSDPMGGPGGSGVWDNAGSSTTGTALDCSGRGVCDYSTGTCKCAQGFFGERCESQSNFV
jgi:hypothetical protein